MFHNFYTTKMNGNAKSLQKRFAKIRSKSGRFSRLMAMIMTVAVLAATIGGAVVMAAITYEGQSTPTSLSNSEDRLKLAREWAEAVKMRDGKAQYELMSRKLQTEKHDDFEAFGWVTGMSSPWMESYQVIAINNKARVTFERATSTGYAGIHENILEFITEDGRLCIDKIISPDELYEGYKTLDTSLFSLAIPEEWTVETFSQKYSSFRLMSDGKEIGGADTRNYDYYVDKTGTPHFGDLDNHSLKISEEKLEHFSVPVYRLVIEHTLPAAAMDDTITINEHYLFLFKEQGVILNLYLDREKVAEAVRMNVAESVTQNFSVLLASVEEKQATLYASQLYSGMYSDMTLYVANNQKRFPWQTIDSLSFFPEMICHDVDGDGQEELVIILCKGKGTGVLREEIHVLRTNDLSEITFPHPVSALKDRVDTQVTESNIQITIDQKPSIMIAKEKTENSFEALAFGSILDFSIKNGTILAKVSAQYSPAGFLGEFTVAYTFKNNRFEANKITFSETI